MTLGSGVGAVFFLRFVVIVQHLSSTGSSLHLHPPSPSSSSPSSPSPSPSSLPRARVPRYVTLTTSWGIKLYHSIYHQPTAYEVYSIYAHIYIYIYMYDIIPLRALLAYCNTNKDVDKRNIFFDVVKNITFVILISFLYLAKTLHTVHDVHCKLSC